MDVPIVISKRPMKLSKLNLSFLSLSSELGHLDDAIKPSSSSRIWPLSRTSRIASVTSWTRGEPFGNTYISMKSKLHSHEGINSKLHAHVPHRPAATMVKKKKYFYAGQWHLKGVGQKKKGGDESSKDI